ARQGDRTDGGRSGARDQGVLLAQVPPAVDDAAPAARPGDGDRRAERLRRPGEPQARPGGTLQRGAYGADQGAPAPAETPGGPRMSRVALVTGAARGIGFTIASRLCESGMA